MKNTKLLVAVIPTMLMLLIALTKVSTLTTWAYSKDVCLVKEVTLLAMRENPSKTSNRVAVLSPEEQFFLIEKYSSDWLYVETFDGIRGYVVAEYVAIFKSSYETSSNSILEAAISFGKQFIGTRYVYGGNSLTKGIDCSAFTKQVMKSQGFVIPRTAQLQSELGVKIPVRDLIRGDLIFFSNTYSPTNITHVGIYLGEGQMLHSGSSKGIEITDLSINWYQERIQFGGRIIK